MKRSLLFVIALLLPMLGMAQKGLPNIEVTDLEGNAFNIQSVMEDGVPVFLSGTQPVNLVFRNWAPSMTFILIGKMKLNSNL